MTPREPPSVEQLILEKIDALEKSMDRRLEDQGKASSLRFDFQDETLGTIERQVTKTNGRVTALEETRATKHEVAKLREVVDAHEAARQRGLGVAAVMRVIPYVAGILLTAAMTILISAATGVHP